jgi:hypothetical protein
VQRVPTYRPKLEAAIGGKPKAAERKVLAAAKAGEPANLSPFGIRPEKPTAATRIRAGLIRFLMLGGDDAHPVHQKGVWIQGAWITGILDMAACESQLDLKLSACHFDTAPDFDDAHLGGLYLPGCQLPGLRGQRMRLEDNLHLRALLLTDGTKLPFAATGPVDIARARITGDLSCAGGWFKGGRALNCEGMMVGASVFMGNGFHATWEVSLSGASITGQLACSGGRFDGAGGRALDCDAMTVGADVFLRDGFHATGAVNLIRAAITGNLVLSNTRIEGYVGFSSAKAGEGLFLWDVAGASHDGPWQNGQQPPRSAPDHSLLVLDLTETEVGVLVDDAGSWAQARTVQLSGFRFRSVQSRMTVTERLQLLHRAHQDRLAVTPTGQRHFPGPAADFDPRAYGELARAYLRQGERKAAARVLEAREDRSRDAELRRTLAAEAPGMGLSPITARLRWLAMWLFKVLFGYGHSSARVFLTLGPLWLALALFFGAVHDRGQFAPNSAVILTSAEWLAAVEQGCPIAWDDAFPAATAAGCRMPQHLWLSGDPKASPPIPPAEAAKDYETFDRWLYAADLFLPLDTIGQTEAWAPSKDRGWWGFWGYYARFPVQLFGWIIIAMAVAVMTGLIGRKED